MLVSAAVNLALARCTCTRSRAAPSRPPCEADAAHHLTDVYTSLGVAGGLALVELTGKTFFDPVLAIVVAALIMWTAWGS